MAPESAYGPTNNCIGIGAELVRLGHRVVFAAEASWAGKLAPFGFTEQLVEMAPPAAEPVAAGQVWIDFVRDTAPHFRTSTLEQQATVTEPIWRELLAGARYADARYAEIVAEVRPDVVVQDNVSALPALVSADAPFVRLVSAQPLEISTPTCPRPSPACRPGTPVGGPPFARSTRGSPQPSGRSTTTSAGRRVPRACRRGHSCTTAGATSTPTPPSWTTPATSVRPGAGCSPASAPRTTYRSCRSTSPTVTGASSTCRWARWAAPTSS